MNDNAEKSVNCFRCDAEPCECHDGQTVYAGDCEDIMPGLAQIDLVFGSPPYCDARTYGIDAQRSCLEWVEWMLRVSLAAQRCCRGPVIWVVAGATRKRCYWPAPEGLMWEWWKRGGDCHLYRPSVFHRVGIPGSGHDDWLRADWEYVICLKRPGKLPWSDNTAAGHKPRWAPGGEMSHRLMDGQRRNQWGGQGGHTMRKASGEIEIQDYSPPCKANPGNLLTGVDFLEAAQAALDDYERGDVRSGKVGGGHMGDRIAHENEAPFPEWLAEVFVCSFCPPDGTVLDPFVGSGTTLAVARKWGRRGIGIDVRESECELVARRLEQTVLFM